MKTTFWIMAGVYWILWIIITAEIMPTTANAEIIFWRVIAFIALGYLAGIYKRVGK